MIKIIIFAAAVLICAAVIRSIYEIRHFNVTKYNIKTSKIDADNFKIIFISDFHSAHNKRYSDRIKSKIKELNPDIILVGGDQIVVHGGKYNLNGLKFLKELSEQYKVIFANGNHEARLYYAQDKYKDAYKLFEQFMAETDIIYLMNDKIELDNNISIYGLDIDREYYIRNQNSIMPDDYLNRKFGQCTEEKFNILIAHSPKYYYAYKKWNADLILSGHYHGGLIGFPGGVGLFSGEPKLFVKMCRGMFEEEGRTFIVSGGLGSHTVNFRLFNKPELIEITICK